MQYIIIDDFNRSLVERIQYTHKDDGTRERLRVAVGRLSGEKYEWAPAKGNPMASPRRIRDGFIETGIPTEAGVEWKPEIKIGARPGETWESRDEKSGYVDRYKFERFDEYTLKRNGKQYCSAVISRERSDDKGDYSLYSESTYAESVGLVKYVVFRKKGGDKLTEWLIAYDVDDETRELTPAERLLVE